MTITRYANTPLSEFIRMIENKNSDSDILNECVVRLERLQQLDTDPFQSSVKCPHCEGTFKVEVDEGKMEILQ